MSKYLIRVSLPEKVAADRIAQSIRAFGSHFATHAHWRHADGVSTGTVLVETDDRRRAIAVVPPNMLTGARIFDLDPAASGASATASGNDPQPYALAA